MPDEPAPVSATTPEVVAAAVARHPGVAALDGGPFGTVASLLPGRRRVLGVRIGGAGEPVELSVVGYLGTPLPPLADELAALVRGVLGPVEVEVTIADVVAPDPTGPDPGAPPASQVGRPTGPAETA